MSFLADTNTLIYASQAQESEIAGWIERQDVHLTDITFRESISNWPNLLAPERKQEKRYLERIFQVALKENRYVDTAKFPAVQIRGLELRSKYNIKINDALIAATAEHFGLTLVTADVTKNFAPRLEKLNAEGLGAFRLKTYAYETREETFAKWNAESPG